MAKYKMIKAKPVSYGGTRSLDKIKYIVIHYTGNDSRTDTAKAECNYFKNGNTRYAGAHYFVDNRTSLTSMTFCFFLASFSLRACS